MTTSPVFRVRLVSWDECSGVLTAIRTAVFVREQAVPADLEMDGRDFECAHALAEDSGAQAIGTGRLMPDGRIGRMAVLAAWRGRGVGSGILAVLMEEARRRGLAEVYLHAQSHAADFYRRHGFSVEGEEYLEAGIAHVGMRSRLAP
jgi:predicted GNAT family N-acyltransferase